MFLCPEADDDAWFYVIRTIVVDVNPSVLNVESCRCHVFAAVSVDRCSVYPLLFIAVV